MTGVILPVVYGDRARWLRRGFAPYLLGTVVGSLVLGLILLGLSQLLLVVQPIEDYSRVAAIGILIAASLDESGLIKLAHPQRNAQVPRGWLYTIGPTRGAFAYGGVLGFGVLTYISSAAFYAAVCYGILILGPSVIVVTMLFGVGRALPVLALSWQVRDGDASDLILRAAAQRGRAHRLLGAILAIATGLALVAPGIL